MAADSENLLTPFAGRLDRATRERLIGCKGRVVWFTGLSGSGKSTIAHALEHALLKSGSLATVLDGDSVRLGLCAGLGFSIEDRSENLRRVAHTAKLMAEAGLTVLCAFVSPLKSQREFVRQIVEPERFHMIYVDASLALCESRDPKGLYRRARAGTLSNFTGISSPYEAPDQGRALVLKATDATAASVQTVVQELGL